MRRLIKIGKNRKTRLSAPRPSHNQKGYYSPQSTRDFFSAVSALSAVIKNILPESGKISRHGPGIAFHWFSQDIKNLYKFFMPTH